MLSSSARISCAVLMPRILNYLRRSSVLLGVGQTPKGESRCSGGCRRADVVMDVSGGAPHPFRMLATVPEGLVGMPGDGAWAAWTGFWSAQVNGRDAVILVSITVTAFGAPGAGAGTAADVLAARLRARHPDAAAVIGGFRTPGGDTGVCLRCPVT